MIYWGLNNRKYSRIIQFLFNFKDNNFQFTSQKKLLIISNIFFNKFISEAINQVFEMACTKCGTVTSFDLSPDNIAFLFKGGTVNVSCGNPQCHGIFLHTRIPFHLGDLVTRLAGKPAMPNSTKHTSTSHANSST